MAELRVPTISSNQCGILDVSFGPSEMSGPSLGELSSSPESMEVDPCSSSSISSPTSPPYSPISSSSSSPHHLLNKEFDETVQNYCSPVLGNPADPPQTWHGYKLVGDNIDKNVKPRNQTLDRQTQSLHYFNCYAVHDRVDLSMCSDDPPKVDLRTLDVDTILPSQQDLDDLIRSVSIIAGRIVHKYIPAFTKIPQLVKAHIKHIHSEQMSRKSKVVSILCASSTFATFM